MNEPKRERKMVPERERERENWAGFLDALASLESKMTVIDRSGYGH